MAYNKRPFNHPRRSASKFRWWHVVAVVVAIAVVFSVLEYLKRSSPEQAVVSSQPSLPPQAAPPVYEQKNYSSVPAVLPPPVAHPAKAQVKGSLAIIVDDMGSSLQEARELIAINIPLTFSIIPGLPKAKAVAAAASDAGMKVMVHLPMEPQGWPKQRLEGNGLLTGQTAEEIAARTETLLAAVPAAAGANNHMGSRFTENEEKMLPVIRVLQSKGLYFVDSRTTPQSVGFSLARKLGVRTATRNVFLDNEQDVAAIGRQLQAAAEMARLKGGVIAICHPHPATIQALKTFMPELKKSGVRFVSAGELVR